MEPRPASSAPLHSGIGWGDVPMVCSHCGGHSGTCHGCGGWRTVDYHKAVRLLQNIWPDAACKCDTCQRLRAQGLVQRKAVA